MRRRLALALPAAALLGSLPLVDCNQFEIHCSTADNCLQGQVCVSGLCQDADGGGTGTGGASGTGGATGTGATGTGATGTGATDGGTDAGACPTPCAAPKPYCVGGACVQCTQATMKTDCPGEKCCPSNACSSLMLCL